MENKLKQFNLEFLAAGILTGVLVWLEAIFPLSLLLVPIPAIYIAVKRGCVYSLITFSFGAITAFVFYGFTAGMFIILNFLPPAIAVTICLKKRLRMFESVLISMAAIALSIIFFIIYVNFKFNSDLLTYFIDLTQKTFVKNQESANAFLIAYNLGEITAGTKTLEYFTQLSQSDAIQMAMVYVKDIFTSYLPTFLGLYILSSGLFNYTLSHYLLKKSGVDLAPIPSFENYTLPKNFIWAIVFVILYVLFGTYINEENYASISTTLITGLIFILAIEGASFASWFLKRKNAGTFFRRFILIFAWLVLYNVFMYMGIFEYIFKVRKSFNSIGDSNKL
ncbi:MAG: DUF2232 domain-containing protein [Eubacteriales bacterium]